LAELSGWQTATRDDARVAEELHEVRAMDRVYPLSTAGFFDELFHYIREIGAWPLLEGLDPQDRVGALYPFLQFVLTTIMRCVGGVQSALKKLGGPNDAQRPEITPSFMARGAGSGTAWVTTTPNPRKH